MKQIATWIGAVIVALIGAFGGRLIGKAQGRRQGKQEAHHGAMEDHIKRVDQGRDALRTGRDSDDDPADRLRRNYGQW